MGEAINPIIKSLSILHSLKHTERFTEANREEKREVGDRGGHRAGPVHSSLCAGQVEGSFRVHERRSLSSFAMNAIPSAIIIHTQRGSMCSLSGLWPLKPCARKNSLYYLGSWPCSLCGMCAQERTADLVCSAAWKEGHTHTVQATGGTESKP